MMATVTFTNRLTRRSTGTGLRTVHIRCSWHIRRRPHFRSACTWPSALVHLWDVSRAHVVVKHQLATFVLVIVCSAAVSHAQELPLFGRLPQPGRDWTLRDQGADKDPRSGYEYAWAMFTNPKSGDILSFVADRYDNVVVRTVGDAAVRQASSDMFPGGYPTTFMRTPPEATKPNGGRWQTLSGATLSRWTLALTAGGRTSLPRRWSTAMCMRTKQRTSRIDWRMGT